MASVIFNGKTYSGNDGMARLVDETTDTLGRPVDEKIKPLVLAFLSSEIMTVGSCEGHLDHGLPYPWVDFQSASNNRVRGLVSRYNGVCGEGLGWSIKTWDEGNLIRIYPINRSLPLAELQKSVSDLSEWMLARPQRRTTKVPAVVEIVHKVEATHKVITENDPFVIWCAGFFDGEGSISIISKPPRNVSVEYHVNVTLTQNNEEVLREVQRRFGGSVYGPWKTDKNPLKRQWVACRQKAHEFLLAIRPHLRVKAKQADLAIEFQNKKWEFGPQNQWTVSHGEEVWAAYKADLQRLNAANKLNGVPKGGPKRKYADLKTRTLMEQGEVQCTL